MKKVDRINISKIYSDTELGNSRLEFNINGNDINYIILNTLRRIIFTDIPIYAYTNFKFNKNTSVFHNNYLKLRISNIPVWGLDNKVETITKSKFELENNYLENLKTVIDTNVVNTINSQPSVEFINNDDFEFDNDENNQNNIQHSSLDELTLYVNYKNKTNTIINVTTDNANFYYNKKQITNPYKIPIPLVKLQPFQEIIFSVITSLGTEEQDAIFSPVSIVTYKEISDNEFIFTLESRGQITELRILHVAIVAILTLLDDYLKLVKEYAKNIPQDNIHKNFIIKLQNGDSTIGNLITKGYQLHSDVEFAGYNIDHPLDTKVNIHYRLRNNNIVNITSDVVSYFKTLYKNIDLELNNIKV